MTIKSGSLLVGRLASLDFLRGVAALAVAIPHYLMLGSTDWPVAQVVSILAVEVFFVLSGFVLAPQILRCLQSAWRSDALTFLARRWMRTIPPYLVALAAITIVSGNIFSGDVAAYVFYVQNFFASLPEKRDYFAVAWSLSVEEWFYIVFALLLFGARLAGLGRAGLHQAHHRLHAGCRACALQLRQYGGLGCGDTSDDHISFRFDRRRFSALHRNGLFRADGRAPPGGAPFHRSRAAHERFGFLGRLGRDFR